MGPFMLIRKNLVYTKLYKSIIIRILKVCREYKKVEKYGREEKTSDSNM